MNLSSFIWFNDTESLCSSIIVELKVGSEMCKI